MKKSKQIVGLDALRFAAALMVLAFHFGFWSWANTLEPVNLSLFAFPGLKPFTWFGWVGVEIFFVLSGFVITYSADGSDGWTFVKHRFTRLFPAALICATLTWLFILTMPSHPGLDVLPHLWARSILFFPSRLIDDSYWTLNIEIKFYSVILLLLLFRQLKRLPLVMGLIGSVSSAYWIAVWALGHWYGFVEGGDAAAQRINFATNVSLLAYGCYFAIGAFLWLCLFRELRWHRVVVLAVCIIGGALQIVFRTQFISHNTGSSFVSMLPTLTWLVSVAIIVFAVIKNQEIAEAVGPRGIRLLRRVGLMTYPLYLLHAKIGLVVMNRLAGHVSGPVALFVTVIFVLVLAAIVSLYLEPPVQNLARRIFALFGGAKAAPVYLPADAPPHAQLRENCEIRGCAEHSASAAKAVK